MIVEILVAVALLSEEFDWNESGYFCATERGAGFREEDGEWRGGTTEGIGSNYLLRPIEGDYRLRWGITIIGQDHLYLRCGFGGPTPEQRNLVCGSGRELFEFDLLALAFIRVDYRLALLPESQVAGYPEMGRLALIQHGSCSPL